jgi:D-serine deaminase-like pyridoxal phosphate-dependent protein
VTTLGERLDEATRGLPAPLAVVDLDALDANATDLVRRTGGVPIRIASKSVRVRHVLDAMLDRPSFAGVMAFSLREALWLVDHGISDVLVGYPTVDTGALHDLAADQRAARAITLMVDDVAQVDVAQRAAGPGAHPLRVCLDVRGVMFYEAQVAGLPDSGPIIRAVKRASVADLARRRSRVVDAVHQVLGRRLELVNSGGSGSIETSSADPVVTEVTAGSGLFVPTLFDGYRAFAPRPAAYFGLDVVRVPAPGYAIAFGGGYVASGPSTRSRLPRPVEPRGLALTTREGAGEVQTPLHGPGADKLDVGDRVWFRHAKAGEVMERFDAVHLVRGAVVEQTVPTYRGEGRTFG